MIFCYSVHIQAEKYVTFLHSSDVNPHKILQKWVTERGSCPQKMKVQHRNEK